MQRSRVIAAAPVRTASEAWQVVTKLMADTLECSPAIAAGSVAEALLPLKGFGPALIAGGHLESNGLVLVDNGIHLTIRVATGDAALRVEENLHAVPGGATATDEWILHLPSVGPLDGAIKSAIKGSAHLTAKEPPASAPAKTQSNKSGSALDLDALRKMAKS